MTESEAIKKVKEFGLYHAIGDLPNSALTVKAFKMAVAALEKQAPKKIIITSKMGVMCITNALIAIMKLVLLSIIRQTST